MDKQKEFILQCEKATEIQELHKPSVCDRYVCACKTCKNIPSIYYIHDYDIDSINKRDLTNVEPHYSNMVRMADVATFHAFYNERTKEHLSYIWLPSQKQLQEMISYEHSWADVFVNKFAEFVTKEYSGKTFGDYSMEQLWLAFVMKEIYSKVWNGEDWIKE